MSTPHPLEEASQQDASTTGYWDPWEGPAPPHWYSGLLEAPFEGLGTGAAKGEAVLGGLVHLAGRLYGSVGKPRVVGQEIAPIGTSIQQDARERVKAMSPDPGTVGTAANVLHGVGEGAELFALGGAGATGALAVGAGEGFGRYQELREHGVERAAAAEAGGLTAVTGTAGAMVPGGFGSTFLTRLLTGAAANTTLGVAGRYGDHLILDANGYHEMADQQRVLDGTQLVADAVLGATFGFLHHLGAPDERRQDAARTAALALQDRRAAPGVAVDPQAAGAHQAALEIATEQLMQGKPVDVADSGAEGATFARRPAPDTAEPLAVMAEALKESGFLDEETGLHDLEAQLEQRQGVAPKAAEPALEPEAPAGRLASDAQLRADLEGMKSETGWFQAGGRVLMDEAGKVTGRTGWIPNAEWWRERPGGYSEEETHQIIDKALAGKRLGPKQQQLINYMTEVADARRAVEPYLPEEGELAVEGLKGGDDAHEVAMVARAASIDPDRVESLAKQHEENDIAFLRAIREYLDGHDQQNAKTPTGRPSGAEAAGGAEEERRAPESAAALADRPHLEITESDGTPVPARDELARANVAAEQSADAPKAVKAAADCYARRGG